MYIGQLLKNLLEWLKRWLWSHDRTGPKPFTAIREKQYPLAILRLVEGRDTPQAQRTWVICPKIHQPDYTSPRSRGFPSIRMHGSNTDVMDIHVYLDFIGAIDGQQHNNWNENERDTKKRDTKKRQEQESQES